MYFFSTKIIENFDIESQKLKEAKDLYFKLLKIYENEMVKVESYLFGTIAVRIDENSFITTIRGKTDLSSYTIVKDVDFSKNITYSYKDKATLNAPLLFEMFKNKQVKYIVHLHNFYDSKLKSYPYYLSNTLRDSVRDNTKSFNIDNHGIIMLFNYNNKEIV
jgi:hypothetical protein